MVKLLQNHHHQLQTITPRKRSLFSHSSSLHPVGDNDGHGDRDQGHGERWDEKGNRRIVTRTTRDHGGPDVDDDLDRDHEDHRKVPSKGHVAASVASTAAANAKGDVSSLAPRSTTRRDVVGVPPASKTVRPEEEEDDEHAMARKRRLHRPSDLDGGEGPSARPPSKRRLRLSLVAKGDEAAEQDVPSPWGAVRDVRAAVSLMTEAVRLVKEVEGMGRDGRGERKKNRRDNWRREILQGLADLQKDMKSMTAFVSDGNVIDETNEADPISAEEDDRGDETIGGIPKRFLDLTHFPRLRSSSRFPADAWTPSPTLPQEGKWKCFPGEKVEEKDHGKGNSTSHIIDCTEGNYTELPAQGGHRDPALPDRIPPTCHSHPHDLCRDDTAMGANASSDGNGHESATQRKEIQSRIYLSHASLSHVNGTYIQEGTYNQAPLFVRVGPPRKFMGKWDCAVVLRRERVVEEEEETTPGGGGADENCQRSREKNYVWKIGLVPSRRITHPRIIGYYYTGEDNATASKTGMTMTTTTRTTLIEDEKEYYEPPTLGWRVYHNKKEGYSSGKASGLRIFYEE